MGRSSICFGWIVIQGLWQRWRSSQWFSWTPAIFPIVRSPNICNYNKIQIVNKEFEKNLVKLKRNSNRNCNCKQTFTSFSAQKIWLGWMYKWMRNSLKSLLLNIFWQLRLTLKSTRSFFLDISSSGKWRGRVSCVRGRRPQLPLSWRHILAIFSHFIRHEDRKFHTFLYSHFNFKFQ